MALILEAHQVFEADHRDQYSQAPNRIQFRQTPPVGGAPVRKVIAAEPQREQRGPLKEKTEPDRRETSIQLPLPPRMLAAGRRHRRNEKLQLVISAIRPASAVLPTPPRTQSFSSGPRDLPWAINEKLIWRVPARRSAAPKAQGSGCRGHGHRRYAADSANSLGYLWSNQDRPPDAASETPQNFPTKSGGLRKSRTSPAEIEDRREVWAERRPHKGRIYVISVGSAASRKAAR